MRPTCLFLLYTFELFPILGNKLIDYADDSTLIAVVLSPGGVTAAESLNLDIGKNSEWCDLRGRKFNASKTKTMSLQVTHNAFPVTPINYWWNWAERV